MPDKYPHTSCNWSKTHTKTGLVRHVAEVRHLVLGKYRVIKDPDASIARKKANSQLEQWHQQWQKAEHLRESAESAAERTAVARKKLAEAESLLHAGLARSIRLTAHSKRFKLPEMEPEEPPRPELQKEPGEPSSKPPPRKPGTYERGRPRETDSKYQVKHGFWDWLDGVSRSEKEERARSLYRRDAAEWEAAQQSTIAEWESRCSEIEKQNREARLEWEHLLSEVRAKNTDMEASHRVRRELWTEKQAKWAERNASHERDVQEVFEKYRSGDPDSVIHYVSAVLDESPYPEWFPRECELDYDPATKTAIVDFRLPTPSDLPTTKEVSYIQTRDEFAEKDISARDRDALYDSLIYQAALRTLHECLAATASGVLESVVFNGGGFHALQAQDKA